MSEVDPWSGFNVNYDINPEQTSSVGDLSNTSINIPVETGEVTSAAPADFTPVSLPSKPAPVSSTAIVPVSRPATSSTASSTSWQSKLEKLTGYAIDWNKTALVLGIALAGVIAWRYGLFEGKGRRYA